MIPTAVIKRTYMPACTPGELTAYDADGEKIFECKTLELPDKGNQSQVSCIPEGTYTCEYTHSHGLNIWCYELHNVPNRAGIRIHNGNYTSQIRGCVLLGKAHADINKDGITDVTESKNTIAAFEAVMRKKVFELKIVKA